MKMAAFSVLVVLVISFTACRGPGGPVERAGRSVDNAVYKVGEGIQRTGRTIENAATGE